ncbi:MAG: hypothetical protein MJE77_05855 [Proteobacteria bacterium]|nr:hypothetical protein [Pseudomonadota bacterium]
MSVAEFAIADISQDSWPTAAWAACLVHALVRDEAAGRRPARLTEPGLATWNRFRGRLAVTDLLALLFEDAAVLHPVPFSARAIGGPPGPGGLDRLPDSLVQTWLEAVPTLDLERPSAEYIAAVASALELPTRMARSDLHVVKPHQTVLELPGSGGQLAHHITSSQSNLALQDNFTIACETWQELTLAGIVALDRAAPHTRFVSELAPDDLRRPDHPLRQRNFDFVIGLHPDKGGHFHISDELAIWFSGAKVLLV